HVTEALLADAPQQLRVGRALDVARPIRLDRPTDDEIISGLGYLRHSGAIVGAPPRRRQCATIEYRHLIYLLKTDALGSVRIVRHVKSTALHDVCVRRDTSDSRHWLRPLARRLARREAAALATAGGLRGVPRLIAFDGDAVLREYVEGLPMHVA